MYQTLELNWLYDSFLKKGLFKFIIITKRTKHIFMLYI